MAKKKGKKVKKETENKLNNSVQSKKKNFSSSTQRTESDIDHLSVNAMCIDPLDQTTKNKWDEDETMCDITMKEHSDPVETIDSFVNDNKTDELCSMPKKGKKSSEEKKKKINLSLKKPEPLNKPHEAFVQNDKQKECYKPQSSTTLHKGYQVDENPSIKPLNKPHGAFVQNDKQKECYKPQSSTTLHKGYQVDENPSINHEKQMHKSDRKRHESVKNQADNRNWQGRDDSFSKNKHQKPENQKSNDNRYSDGKSSMKRETRWDAKPTYSVFHRNESTSPHKRKEYLKCLDNSEMDFKKVMEIKIKINLSLKKPEPLNKPHEAFVQNDKQKECYKPQSSTTLHKGYQVDENPSIKPLNKPHGAFVQNDKQKECYKPQSSTTLHKGYQVDENPSINHEKQMHKSDRKRHESVKNQADNRNWQGRDDSFSKNKHQKPENQKSNDNRYSDGKSSMKRETRWDAKPTYSVFHRNESTSPHKRKEYLKCLDNSEMDFKKVMEIKINLSLKKPEPLNKPHEAFVQNDKQKECYKPQSSTTLHKGYQVDENPSIKPLNKPHGAFVQNDKQKECYKPQSSTTLHKGYQVDENPSINHEKQMHKSDRKRHESVKNQADNRNWQGRDDSFSKNKHQKPENQKSNDNRYSDGKSSMKRETRWDAKPTYSVFHRNESTSPHKRKEYLKCLDNSEMDFKKVMEINEDLFMMSNEYSLGHCVAVDMNMGSGIAVSFRQKFKNVDDLLNQRQHVGGVAVLEEQQRFIYYLVTKRYSSGKPTYETLWESLQKMKAHIVEHNVKKLALPRIGCGLDSLEWKHVKKMIKVIFTDVEIEITICNFQQNYGKTKRKLQQKKEPSPKLKKGKTKRR